jgi:tetratricopeptide (TPR) repeat protein
MARRGPTAVCGAGESCRPTAGFLPMAVKLSPLVAAALALAGFAVTLPVALPRPSAGASDADCLTISDRPPTGDPADRAARERCRSLHSDDAELLADLGDEYDAANDQARAEAAYRQALSIDPAFADVRLKLGRLLLRSGRRDDALREAEAALRVQPNRRSLIDLRRQASTPGPTEHR